MTNCRGMQSRVGVARRVDGLGARAPKPVDMLQLQSSGHAQGCNTSEGGLAGVLGHKCGWLVHPQPCHLLTTKPRHPPLGSAHPEVHNISKLKGCTQRENRPMQGMGPSCQSWVGFVSQTADWLVGLNQF
ncbi:hypothetical protein ABBQ38_001420 [Trebouxia sp. C0009 RCD-2024]